MSDNHRPLMITTPVRLEDGFEVDVNAFAGNYRQPVELEYEAGPITMKISMTPDQARRLADALQDAAIFHEGGEA